MREDLSDQDAVQESENRLRSNSAGLLKSVGQKGLAVGKSLGYRLGKKAVIYLLGLVGPLAFIIAVIIILALILFAGIYWGMTEESILTDATAQAQDIEVEKYAVNRADKSNVFNTWVVSGEVEKGQKSWHELRMERENQTKIKEYLSDKYQEDYNPVTEYDEEGNVKRDGLGYYGEDMPEYRFMGKLVDNNGLDLKFKNYWGDIYAPIMFDSIRFNEDNLMNDEKFRKDGFQETGFELKPYFYYKPSTITVSTTDEEGKTHTTTEHIYLLVEVFSLRGYEQYHYEWKTYTSKDGKTTITQEVLRDTEVIDDGRKYLTAYLEKRLELENADQELIVDAVFEAMQGFTAKKEWMRWLADNNISLNALISAAAIPSEFFSILKEAAILTGIPEHILAAIILKESTWNPKAINEKTGCFGLTQLDPDYWGAWAVRYGFDPVSDMWNPRAQIIVGAMVLRDFIGVNNMPDWNSRNWDKEPALRAALARYGGYGEDIDAASDYINDIAAKARAYIAPAIFPASGYGMANITSNFGERSGGFHGAIDIGCPSGTQIVSASAGVVTKTGWHPGYGYYIIVSDLNYDYFYAHLSAIDVQVNQEVIPGTDIGLSGNTGSFSTGPHLHFSISMVGGDPMSYVGAVNPINILH